VFIIAACSSSQELSTDNKIPVLPYSENLSYEENRLSNSQVRINLNTHEKYNYFNAQLINGTDSSFIVPIGINKPSFRYQALDSNNEWNRLYNFSASCIWSDYQLRPNSKVAYKLQKKDIKGEFSSKVRLVYKLKDSLIVSNSIDCSIDSLLFLNDQDRMYVQVLERLKMSGLTQEQFDKLKLFQAKFSLNNFKDYKTTIGIARELLTRNKSNYEVLELLYKAVYFDVLYSKNIKLTKIQNAALISNYISQLNKIPETYQGNTHVKNLIKSNKKQLLTKIEFNSLRDENCNLIEDEYYYNLDLVNVKNVKMLFRD